jgi:hypothetical protein
MCRHAKRKGVLVVLVTTNWVTKESARRERFEPAGNVTATNVQKAIKQVDTEGAGKISQVGTVWKPPSPATVAILPTDIEVGIDTRTTEVTATLLGAATWAAANPNGLELVLNDYFGNAAANAIAPSLFAGDSFVYGGVTPAVSANFGLLRLRPDPSLPGWVVREFN